MGAGKEAREASPRRRALVAAQRSKTKNKNYSDGVSNNDNERRRDLPSVGKDLGGGGVSAHNLQREKFLECVRARASCFFCAFDLRCTSAIPSPPFIKFVVVVLRRSVAATAPCYGLGPGETARGEETGPSCARGKRGRTGNVCICICIEAGGKPIGNWIHSGSETTDSAYGASSVSVGGIPIASFFVFISKTRNSGWSQKARRPPDQSLSSSYGILRIRIITYISQPNTGRPSDIIRPRPSRLLWA